MPCDWRISASPTSLRLPATDDRSTQRRGDLGTPPPARRPRTAAARPEGAIGAGRPGVPQDGGELRCPRAEIYGLDAGISAGKGGLPTAGKVGPPFVGSGRHVGSVEVRGRLKPGAGPGAPPSRPPQVSIGFRALAAMATHSTALPPYAQRCVGLGAAALQPSFPPDRARAAPAVPGRTASASSRTTRSRAAS